MPFVPTSQTTAKEDKSNLQTTVWMINPMMLVIKYFYRSITASPWFPGPRFLWIEAQPAPISSVSFLNPGGLLSCLWLSTQGTLHPGCVQRKGHKARETRIKPPVLSTSPSLLLPSRPVTFQVPSHRCSTNSQAGVRDFKICFLWQIPPPLAKSWCKGGHDRQSLLTSWYCRPCW